MTGLIEIPEIPASSGIIVAAPTQLTAEQILEQIGPWLPRFQLFGSNSTAVKEKVIQAGNWGIPVSPQTILDLGLNVDVILVASRKRAMWYDGEKMHSSTDPASALYLKLKAMSDADGDSGAMYGTEFLTWVGPIQLFCSLFLASQSARRETLGFLRLMNQSAEVSSRLIGSKRKWEIPVIEPTAAFPFAMPSKAVVTAAFEKYTKPDDAAEIADSDNSSSRQR